MKKRIIIFIGLIVLNFCIFSNEKYTEISEWYYYENGEYYSGGKSISNLEIEKINNDEIRFIFNKSVQPFSQIIRINTKAILKNGKYYFSFTDNFNNSGNGYIVWRTETKIEICFEEIEFNELGKNLARMYDDIELLYKTFADFPIKL